MTKGNRVPYLLRTISGPLPKPRTAMGDALAVVEDMAARQERKSRAQVAIHNNLAKGLIDPATADRHLRQLWG